MTKRATVVDQPLETFMFRNSSKMVRCEVREEQGDLFSAPLATSLAHCVSSDMKMGAGIAVLFRQKFGCVENLKNQGKSVGEVAYLKDGPRYIFYLVTKQWFYNKPTEETLLSSLVEMRDLCDEFGVKRLAMPRIGCGLDGLQWPVVYEMVKEVFSHCDMEVTIYSIPDRKPMIQKSMTPNLQRTQENFRNYFESKRPSSLPASQMASKRKIHSYSYDNDEYDTPKKRMKTSSHEDNLYQRDQSHYQPTSKSSHYDSKNTFRSHLSPQVNSDFSAENDFEEHQSHELIRRGKQSASSPWNKPSSTQTSSKNKSDFLALPSKRSRDVIPFLSDEDARGKTTTRDSKRSSLHFSSFEKSSPTFKNRKYSTQNDKTVIPFLSDDDTRDEVPSRESKRSSLINSSCDKSSPIDKKRKHSRQDDYSSEEEEWIQKRQRAKSENEQGSSQHQKSPDSKKKSRDHDKNNEMEDRDLYRSKKKKGKDSGGSRERKSRDSIRSKERKSRDSSRSEERKSRDSSRSEERYKSRDFSRSKERKSSNSHRSKEKKSRETSRSEDRKSRDSSRSVERGKSRDRSRSEGRKSRDSRRSKERRSRDSSRSQDRKARGSGRSNVRRSRDSSRSEEREPLNKSWQKSFQHSDQSDNESTEVTPSESIRTKERHQSFGEKVSASSSQKNSMTSNQHGRQGHYVTEYYSYKVKKVVHNYPSLNICKKEKRTSTSVPTGGLYSDKPDASNSVKNRLSLNCK
ncbi:hypothetical protein FOCC_FOCC012012 [Frankliniella occidentalis]|nr:hypothetical protein FOCC_FOCC012012 [Frankliniella occidentalis]